MSTFTAKECNETKEKTMAKLHFTIVRLVSIKNKAIESKFVGKFNIQMKKDANSIPWPLFLCSFTVAWPLNESDAVAGLVLIETSLLFSC